MLGHIFSGPVHLNKCCDLTPAGKEVVPLAGHSLTPPLTLPQWDGEEKHKKR